MSDWFPVALVAAALANALILVVAVRAVLGAVRARDERAREDRAGDERPERAEQTGPSGSGPGESRPNGRNPVTATADAGSPLQERDRRMAAAIERFVREVDPLVAGRPAVRVGAGESVAAADAATDRDIGAEEGEALPDRVLSTTAWGRVVRDETVRFARYRRPTAAVVAELVGSGLGGDDAGLADRLIPPTAEVLVGLSRASDRTGHLGPARFGVLLLEAGESGAESYVRRVRQACDDWLEAVPIDIALSIGWASPGPGEHLTDAFRAADARRSTTALPPLADASPGRSGPPRGERRAVRSA